MSDLNKELSELASDIRAHLEFRRALGVRTIELPPPGALSHNPSAQPVSPPPAPKAADRPGRVPPPVARAATAPVSAPQTLAAVCEEIGGCTRCKLHQERTNLVIGEGNPGAVLVFVGEGPGAEEDREGRPFAGEAGQLLTDIIVKGMKLRKEDVYICNAVKCRTPGDRAPVPDEVRACGEFLKKQIAAIRPKVIVTLGNVPTQALLATKEGITKLRGSWREYDGIPVMPTFHPAYLLRSPGEKKKVWEDIQKVMAKLGSATQK